MINIITIYVFLLADEFNQFLTIFSWYWFSSIEKYFAYTTVIVYDFGTIFHTGQCLRRIAGGNVGVPLDTT